MNIKNDVCTIPFRHHHDVYLQKMHLFLNKTYYAILFGTEKESIPDELHMRRFKTMEGEWAHYEEQHCLVQYPCEQQVRDVFFIKKVLSSHPVFDHVLFDYLCHLASESDIKNFILNESILNLEFFDYLAFALPGTRGQMKSEIARNLWDEAGKGEEALFHTTLFERLMHDLELKYDREAILSRLSWEALAGINLFNRLASYPVNKMKYFGLLAATELLDPLHYTKFIQGLSRVFRNKSVDYRYYSEHETIDVLHAQGWLEKVIFPTLLKNPEKTKDFWIGFYLRLDSAKRYYDQLFDLISNQSIAA